MPFSIFQVSPQPRSTKQLPVSILNRPYVNLDNDPKSNKHPPERNEENRGMTIFSVYCNSSGLRSCIPDCPSRSHPILLMENRHIDRNVSEMDGFQTCPPPNRCQVPRVSGGRSRPYPPSQVDGLPNHHCHWHPPQQCLHLLQAPPYQ